MSEIKVGSEWVDRYGTKVVVKYIGINILTYQYDNIENAARLEHFLAFHKPAPVRRTFWLNVYAWGVSKYENKVTAYNNKYKDILWQQEVELIDPREGEKG